MKAVLQRVKKCSLKADGVPFSEIGKGMLVLVGISENDTQRDAEKLASKIVNLRIFEDSDGKMNLSINHEEIKGEIMAVSNFTLYGDCRKGRRPDFFGAAKPDKAQELYDFFVSLLKKETEAVKTGVFGADMEIDIKADGPVTLIIESAELA